MIYRLQRKFIIICAVSIFSVIVIVFAAILLFNISSTNKNLDILADSVSEGGGRFPAGHRPGSIPPKDQHSDFITPETPFSTRHFTVFFDGTGKVVSTHTDSIYAIT